MHNKNSNRQYLDKKLLQQQQQKQKQQQQQQGVIAESGIIPKPPPFLSDLTKIDKQNNIVQIQHAAIQTTATVHVAKQSSGNSRAIRILRKQKNTALFKNIEY